MQRAASFLLFAVVALSGCITDPLPDALDYLETAWDGGDESTRVKILVAAAATGQDLQAWPSPESPVLDGLAFPNSHADRMRVLGVMAERGIQNNATEQLIQAAWSVHDGEQFGLRGNIVGDALTLTALLHAGVGPSEPRLANATQMLLEAQAEDGGWRYDGTAPGEVDETAFVLQALDAAGALNQSVRDAALGFLKERSSNNGAFGYGGTENCHSTGLALLAWSFVAEEPPSSTMRYVAACQNPDGGFPFTKGGPSQAWATSEIVLGLAAWS